MISEIIKRLSEALETPAVLHEPWFKGNEEKYVRDCVTSGWVSSVGKYVDRFEGMLQETTGVASATAVCNGTTALHMCYQLVGVKPGEEVLIPALSFVATAAAVCHGGAIPHFVDSCPQSFSIDVPKLREYLKENFKVENGALKNKATNRRLAALCVVHVLGHISDMAALQDLCEEFDLPLVEDAAEALGSTWNGRHAGQFGKASALSFNGNKVVTTGGGGAILTNDKDLGQQAKHLTTTAKEPHPFRTSHNEVGFNYRLPNINAALGCAQLENLPDFLRSKRRHYQNYQNIFADLDQLEVVSAPENCESNYWLCALRLSKPDRGFIDKLIEALAEAKISVRPFWEPLHTLAPYKGAPRMDLSQTEAIQNQIICLPSSANLKFCD